LAPRETSLLLEEAEWNAIVACATTLEHAAGDVVLREGEQYQRVWQITEGECDVRLGTGVVVGRVVAGDVFGEISFLVGGGASATIVAASTTTLQYIERQKLQLLFDARPALAPKFYKFLALVMRKRFLEREQSVIEKMQ
jgi:CRP-like cAMP-binding protein